MNGRNVFDQHGMSPTCPAERQDHTRARPVACTLSARHADLPAQLPDLANLR